MTRIAPLPLAAVLLFCATLRGEAQVPTTATIVDANGLSLGRVVDMGNPVVVFDINGVVLGVVVFEDHLQVAGGVSVYFSGPNCTGAAYSRLPIASMGLNAPATIIGPANSLYLGPRAAAADVPYSSQWPAGWVCQNAGGVADGVVPVEHVLDFTPPYQPPFAFQSSPFSVEVPTSGRWALAAFAAALAAAACVLLLRRV